MGESGKLVEENQAGVGMEGHVESCVVKIPCSGWRRSVYSISTPPAMGSCLI